MSELHEIAYSKAALWQLGLFGCVALVACATRNRRVAPFGGIGLFLGFVVPQPRVYADYSSVEGAYMGAFNGIVDHLVFWAFVGAAIGTSVGLFLTRRQKATAIAPDSDIRSNVTQ